MATSYSYTISADFPSGFCSSNLENEINNELSITVKLQSIDRGGDNVTITFISAISAGEKTTLDSVVANHDPTKGSCDSTIYQIGTTGAAADYGTLILAQRDDAFNSTLITNPDGYSPLVVTKSGSLKTIPESNTTDNYTFDAFSRQRVSVPNTIFETTFLTSKQPDRWSETVTGTGVGNYTSGDSWIEMRTTGTGSVIRQSRRYINYQPGKSLLLLATGTLIGSTKTGVTSRIGFFDDDDGIFFQLQNTTFSIVKRSSTTGSVVETVVNQGSFNIDNLDGTGVSKILLDPTKRNNYVMEIQWFGIGEVTLFIFINRLLVPIHRFFHSNRDDVIPYMNRASLPIRYSITDDGTGGATLATMYQLSCTAISEGGYNPLGSVYSISRITPIIVDVTEVPVLSIRADSNHPKMTINPIKVNAVSITTTVTIIYRVYRVISPLSIGAGPLTGASWTAVPSIDSGTEYDVSSTAVSGLGTTYPFQLFDSAYFTDVATSREAFIVDKLRLTTDINLNNDWLIITMRKISGSGTDEAVCSVQWQEIE